jgi:hypothetical protein
MNGTAVLDASALLAYLQGEPAAAVATTALMQGVNMGAFFHSVNSMPPMMPPSICGCHWMTLDYIGLRNARNPLCTRKCRTYMDTIGLSFNGADGSRTRVRPGY